MGAEIFRLALRRNELNEEREVGRMRRWMRTIRVCEWESFVFGVGMDLAIRKNRARFGAAQESCQVQKNNIGVNT